MDDEETFIVEKRVLYRKKVKAKGPQEAEEKFENNYDESDIAEESLDIWKWENGSRVLQIY